MPFSTRHAGPRYGESGRRPAAPRSPEPQRPRLDFLPLGFAHSSRGKKVSSKGTVAPNATTAGEKVTISAKVRGGISPYEYNIIFDGAAKGIDTSKMNINGKSSATGDISEQILLPLAVPNSTELTARVVVGDARGVKAESSEAKFTVSPKP